MSAATLAAKLEAFKARSGARQAAWNDLHMDSVFPQIPDGINLFGYITPRPDTRFDHIADMIADTASAATANAAAVKETATTVGTLRNIVQSQTGNISSLRSRVDALEEKYGSQARQFEQVQKLHEDVADESRMMMRGLRVQLKRRDDKNDAFENRLEALEEKLASIEGRVTASEDKVTNVEEKIEAQYDDLKQGNAEVKRSMADLIEELRLNSQAQHQSSANANASQKPAAVESQPVPEPFHLHQVERHTYQPKPFNEYHYSEVRPNEDNHIPPKEEGPNSLGSPYNDEPAVEKHYTNMRPYKEEPRYENMPWLAIPGQSMAPDSLSALRRDLQEVSHKIDMLMSRQEFVEPRTTSQERRTVSNPVPVTSTPDGPPISQSAPATLKKQRTSSPKPKDPETIEEELSEPEMSDVTEAPSSPESTTFSGSTLSEHPQMASMMIQSLQDHVAAESGEKKAVDLMALLAELLKKRGTDEKFAMFAETFQTNQRPGLRRKILRELRQYVEANS